MDPDPLLEPVAQQFRMAYQQGTCDPDNCPECDCHLDDVLRERIHSEANRLAAGVIAKVRDSERLTQLLNTDEPPWADEVRREAAAELTRLAQEMGFIP